MAPQERAYQDWLRAADRYEMALTAFEDAEKHANAMIAEARRRLDIHRDALRVAHQAYIDAPHDTVQP